MNAYKIIALSTLCLISNSYTSETSQTSDISKKISRATDGKSIAKLLREALDGMAPLSSLKNVEENIKTIKNDVTLLNTVLNDSTSKTNQEMQAVKGTIATIENNINALNATLQELTTSIEQIQADLIALNTKHNSHSSSQSEPTPQNIASSPSSDDVQHQASIQALQEKYIQTTKAFQEVTQLQQTLLEMSTALHNDGEATEKNNRETITALTALCNKVEQQCNDLHSTIATPSIESQLFDLTKKHASHLDTFGSSCMLCYLVWKILEKPNKILPRISVETKKPIIEFCKNVSASAVLNAALNRVRGTAKNGWSCMGIFACLDIAASRIYTYLEQRNSADYWIKKPNKNKTIIPYISWILKASIAHLLA